MAYCRHDFFMYFICSISVTVSKPIDLKFCNSMWIVALAIGVLPVVNPVDQLISTVQSSCCTANPTASIVYCPTTTQTLFIITLHNEKKVFNIKSMWLLILKAFVLFVNKQFTHNVLYILICILHVVTRWGYL
jgi:hypothetical protein